MANEKKAGGGPDPFELAAEDFLKVYRRLGETLGPAGPQVHLQAALDVYRSVAGHLAQAAREQAARRGTDPLASCTAASGHNPFWWWSGPPQW